MSGLLEGKTALVIGGTDGIGKIIAYELAKEGANIALLTHNPEWAADMAEDLKVKYGTTVLIDSFVQTTDVPLEIRLAATYQKFTDTFGRIDIAINSSGFSPYGPHYNKAPVAEILKTDLDRVIENMLKGIFTYMKFELLQMQKQGSGVIVNFSYFGLDSVADISLYCAAKAGVAALTKCAAKENKDKGIRINMVCAEYAADPEDPKHDNLSKALDIARTVVWLCADSASSISGNIFYADNGPTAIG